MREIDARSEKLAWVAALYGLLTLVAAVLLCRVADLTALVPACIASAVVMVMGLIAVGYGYFVRRQNEEEHDYREHREGHQGTELFDNVDDAVQVARRACEVYGKYVVPGAAVLSGAAVLTAVGLFWRAWGEQLIYPVAERPLPFSVLGFSLSIAGLIAGSYYSGVSRERNCRWLRPCSAWMFLSSILFLLGGLVLIGEHSQFHAATLDPRVARVGVGVLGLLGVELVLSVVVEYYRPRSPGEELRPMFESRILALFTEPGGFARNVAAALDYQFGFEVSEVWFYRSLERTMIPFVIVMIATMWLLTCLVVVTTEENGIRERFGRVVDRSPLKPGLYFKLPWPLARIHKSDVERVREIEIGYRSEGGEDESKNELNEPEAGTDPNDRVIVWSQEHVADETNFVVASETIEQLQGGEIKEGDLPVSVYFISASTPVYFKVSNLYDYAYRHADAQKTLEEIATRELTRYLANVDFFGMLTDGLEEGAKELAKNIQSAADGMELGVEIVFVGLQGLHPPVSVGGAFDAVVGAMEKKHELILKAEQYALKTKPEAEAEAIGKVMEARSYRQKQIDVSKAEADRFGHQLVGYNASPDLFVLRSFLEVLENEGMEMRKYVVAAREGLEVYEINLEQKMRPDLLDVDLERKQE